MEGIITFLLVLIAFDISSISSKLEKINENLININNQIKKESEENNDNRTTSNR